MDIQNVAAGSVVLTPVTSTIDQGASLTLTINQGLRLVSTGSAYLTQRGQGSGSSGGTGSGTVTNTQGALATNAIVTGNGGSDLKTQASGATLDSHGNVTIPGTLTTDTACGGCAGAIDLLPGSDPGGAQPANSFSLIAPQAISSAYRWKVPAADAAGAISSDGGGHPGTLSIVPFSGSGNIARTTSAVLTTPIIASYTVATLPPGLTPGKLAYVTDGNSTSDCSTGGGANQVLCAFTGSSWAFPGYTGGGNARRSCVIDNDTQSSSALVASQFSGSCIVPAASSIVEVDVWGGTGVVGAGFTMTGTGSINLQKYTPNGGATAAILSAPLATANGLACALTSAGGTCINGTASSSAVTLSNTSLAAGDWVRVSTANPDGNQTWYRIAIVYTVN
jgi:hypothetical protein